MPPNTVFPNSKEPRNRQSHGGGFGLGLTQTWQEWTAHLQSLVLLSPRSSGTGNWFFFPYVSNSNLLPVFPGTLCPGRDRAPWRQVTWACCVSHRLVRQGGLTYHAFAVLSPDWGYRDGRDVQSGGDLEILPGTSIVSLLFFFFTIQSITVWNLTFILSGTMKKSEILLTSRCPGDHQVLEPLCCGHSLCYYVNYSLNRNLLHTSTKLYTEHGQ